MNDRSRRVNAEWNRYLAAGPVHGDPFWEMVEDYGAALRAEVEKRKPQGSPNEEWVNG